MRYLTLALLVCSCAPAALAQQPNLVGTWAVERFTDSNAEPAPEDGLSALFPDNPYTFAPVRLRFGPSGEATVTLLVARHDGYEVVEVPSAYRFETSRLVISLDDLDTNWSAEERDDGLLLTAEDGSVLTLHRAQDA